MAVLYKATKQHRKKNRLVGERSRYPAGFFIFVEHTERRRQDMSKTECALHVCQGEEAGTTNPLIELEKQVALQIGDITILATAHYRNEGTSCVGRLLDALIEEAKKQ